MPHHKSCKKRMRTSAEARLRNRAFRSRLRSAIKAVRNESNPQRAAELLRKATSLLDRAAARGIIHRRNAARQKSRLALFIQKLH